MIARFERPSITGKIRQPSGWVKLGIHQKPPTLISKKRISASVKKICLLHQL